MTAKQYFNAEGNYLGATYNPPEDAIESPEIIYDARGVTLNVETNTVIYPDAETLKTPVERIQTLYEALPDTERLLIGPEVDNGLSALQIGSTQGVQDAMTRGATIAEGNQTLETFLTEINAILNPGGS